MAKVHGVLQFTLTITQLNLTSKKEVKNEDGACRLSHAERIIACVAAELSATHLEAKTLGKFVKRVAKKLTAILACYLAGEVVLILSPIAAIGHREMVAPMYHPLLTPVFWVRLIYGASARLVKAPERHKSRNGATVNRACEDPVHSQSPKGRTDECHPT